jgi:hypothetical protein
MGKRPEDEIQQKLVELELSIKEDEAKRNVPAQRGANSTELVTSSTSITPTTNDAAKMDADLFMLGGWGLVGVSAFLFLSHMTIGTAFSWTYFGGSTGLLIVPLLVGIGMLFYNYKSRVAQYITAGSFLALLLTMLLTMTIRFPPLSAVNFVIMALPLCFGGALLAKGHQKNRELADHQKTIK